MGESFWGVPSGIFALLFAAIGTWTAMYQGMLTQYEARTRKHADKKLWAGVLGIFFGLFLAGGSLHAIGAWSFAWFIVGLALGFALYLRVGWPD